MATPLQAVGHGLLLFGAQPLYHPHPGVVYDVLEYLLKPASRYALQPDFGHDLRHRTPLVGDFHLLIGNGDGPAQVAHPCLPVFATLVAFKFVVQVFDKLPQDRLPPLFPFTFLVTCTTFGINRVVWGFDLTDLKGGDTGSTFSQPLGEVADKVVGECPNRATNAAALNRQGKAALPGLPLSIRFESPQVFPHPASGFGRSLQHIGTRQTASPSRSDPQ